MFQANKFRNTHVLLKLMVLWGFLMTALYQLTLSLGSTTLYSMSSLHDGSHTAGEAGHLAAARYERGCYLGRYCIKYLITPNTVCSPGRPKLLLSFILSSTPHFAHRQIIRETWANSTLFRGDDLGIVFVLARMRNESKYWDAVQEEARVHNDVLMLDFVEAYDNLTLKTISGLYWTAHFCPQAKFVLNSV